MQVPVAAVRNLAAALFLALPVAASALPRYRIEAIGVPPGQWFSQVVDVNNAGVAVGIVTGAISPGT